MSDEQQIQDLRNNFYELKVKPLDPDTLSSEMIIMLFTREIKEQIQLLKLNSLPQHDPKKGNSLTRIALQFIPLKYSLIHTIKNIFST